MPEDPSLRVLPRLWCCAAANAPIVAVFARCHASVKSPPQFRAPPHAPGTRWSCVLRWDWAKGTVTEGSWTTMELRPLRAVLSACGEYLLFHAKTNDDGPFSARNGPRYAVSRLPWLVPLTHPQSFGPGGAGLSQYALSKAQQERLWAMFPGFFWRQTDDEWPRHLTPGVAASALASGAASGWKSVSLDDAAFEGSGFAEHLQTIPAPEGGTATIAPHLIAIHPVVLDPASGAQVALVAAVARTPSSTGEPGTGWNVWEGQLRFFALVHTATSVRVMLLDGVRWAKPTGDGRLLTASSDCRLRLSRWTAGTGRNAWTVEQEHDLSGLLPRAAPTPAEATRGLR